MHRPAAPPIAAIVGPTASGKTQLALAVAAELPIEILVADSRQVYRGMNVGTAKPGDEERQRVPHHLLDLVGPDQRFTVADWVERARELIPAIVDRGRLPLVVGGTGLYVSSLVDGYDYPVQPWAPELRERLARELETDGLPALAARLARLDPAAAARTDLRNPRRVLRALERVEAGGGGQRPTATPYAGKVVLLGIDRPREVLYRRIEARAATMFAAGLLDETRALLDAGYAPSLPSMSGHGYREAARVLAGEWGVEEARAETARRVRQYAKRQLTWFRRDHRITWLAAGEGEADEGVLTRAALTTIRAGLERSR